MDAERDAQLVADYEAGKPATRLARAYGLSVSHVRAILAANKVSRAAALPRPYSDRIISPVHQKLGARVYAYRFNRANDVQQASDFLNWSVRKLRGVEQGVSDVTLEDLQDLARYMKLSLSELMKDL